jgi:hypothetical protein
MNIFPSQPIQELSKADFVGLYSDGHQNFSYIIGTRLNISAKSEEEIGCEVLHGFDRRVGMVAK